jgi:hypothetical protein
MDSVMRLFLFPCPLVRHTLLLVAAFTLCACSSNLRFDDDQYQPLDRPGTPPLTEEARAWS